jgi:hypothetical protein
LLEDNAQDVTLPLQAHDTKYETDDILLHGRKPNGKEGRWNAGGSRARMLPVLLLTRLRENNFAVGRLFN